MEWLRPYKLAEHLAPWDGRAGLSMAEAEKLLYHGATNGTVRVKWRGHVHEPGWLVMKLRQMRSDALPPDIELNVEDAERLVEGAA